MFGILHTGLGKAKPVCKIPHMCILADVWLLPNMFGKNQTRWYIYTWVLFSTHVCILTHMFGKRHTCVKKATQIYVCKCWAFSTHVWEKPMTCLFPPELSVRKSSVSFSYFVRYLCATFTQNVWLTLFCRESVHFKEFTLFLSQIGWCCDLRVFA